MAKETSQNMIFMWLTQLLLIRNSLILRILKKAKINLILKKSNIIFNFHIYYVKSNFQRVNICFFILVLDKSENTCKCI